MPGNMDERVVSMQFDNKKFEKNVKTSMKTLDDLKESLDFDKSSKSLNELEKGFKKFGQNNHLENVNGTLSNMQKNMLLLGDSSASLFKKFAEVTKITALFRMAERAVNSLERSIKQFTIQPITQGFSKYETKIGSIKTIANATGMAADAVNESLDRLNWFTDETSASFGEMVQNIGKFTSVGKGLDESITAMEGIATWGYHSGANIAEMNRAMYNLSQALGTGSVKLIDWKSIENAGMATKEFKEQAIAAAEAAGKLKRKGDKLFAGNQEVNSQNFNATLQKGWFTSDVLMDTLKVYGGFADEVKKYQEEHPQYALAAEAMEAMDAEREKNHDKYMAEVEKLINGVNADSEEEAKAISKGKITKSGMTLEEADKMAKAAKTTTKATTELAKKTKMSSKQIVGQIDEINKIVSKEERKKAISKFANETGSSVKELTELLDKLAECEETIGEKAFKSSQQSKSLNDSIEATKDAVSTQWMNSFQTIFGGLDKSIELWSDVTEILWELFAAGGDTRNNALTHWAEEFNGWADLWNADEEKGPLGALRNIMNTIIELKDLLASSFKNVFFSGLKNAINNVTGGEAEDITNKVYTVDQLRQRKEGSYLGAQIKAVTSGIREFTAKINEFFTNESNMQKISQIFTAFAKAVRFAWSVVKGFFETITNVVERTGIFQTILNVLSKVSEKISSVFDEIRRSGFVTKVFDKIGNTLVWFYNLIKNWVDQIRSFLDKSGVGKAISDFFTRIKEFFLGGENDVDENGNKIESGFFRMFGWVKNVKEWFEKINLESALNSVKKFIDNFSTIWNAFVGGLNGNKTDKNQLIHNGMDSELAGIIDGISNFGNKLSGVFGFFKDVFDKVVGWLESSGILPTLRSWWGELSKWFGDVSKDVQEKGFFTVIGEFFSGLWTSISDTFNNIVGWLESSGILSTIRSVWEGIRNFFGNLGTIWNAFVGGLNGNKTDSKQLVHNGMDNQLAGMLEFFSNIGTKLYSVFGFFKGIFDGVVGWMESSGILPTIRGWWENIVGIFKGADEEGIIEKGFFARIINAFKTAAAGIKTAFGWIKGKWDIVVAWISEKWGQFKDWLETSGVLPKIRSIWEGIKKFFGNLGTIWNAFVGGLNGNKTDKKLLIHNGMDGQLAGMLETVSNIGGWIHTAIQKVKEIWDKVVGWLESSGVLPTLRGWWEGIKGWFEEVAKDIQEKGFFGAVGDFFSGLWEKITGIFGGLFGGGEEKKNEIVDTAGGSAEEKKGGILGGMFENIKNAFLPDGKFDFFKGLGASITAVVKGAIDILSGLSWKDIAKFLVDIVVDSVNAINEGFGHLEIDNIISVLLKIMGAFSVFMVIKTISDIFTTLRAFAKKGEDKSLLEKITDFVGALGKALLEIGGAFALIAASIWVLSTIDDKNLVKALLIIGGIAAFFAVILIYAAKFQKSEKIADVIGAMGQTFINLGYAVGLISLAIIALTLLFRFGDPAHIWGAIFLVGGILVAMGALIVIISKFSGNSAIQISGTLASFAGLAVLLVAITACLVILQGVDYQRAWEDLGLIMGCMGVLAVFLWFISKKIQLDKKVIAPFVLMIVLFGLIAATFIILKDTKPETLMAIGAGLAIALIGLVTAMKILSELKLGPAIQGAAAAGSIILIISAAIAGAGLIISAAAKGFCANLVSVMSSIHAAGIAAEGTNHEAITKSLDLLTIIAVAFAACTFSSNKKALDLAQQAWDVFSRFKLASTAAKLVNPEQYYKIFGEDGKGGLLKIIQEAMASVTESKETGWTASRLLSNVETLAENMKLVGRAGLDLAKEGEDGTYVQGIQNVKDRLEDIQGIVTLATTIGTTVEGEDLKQIDLTEFAKGIANIGAALQLYNKALATLESEGKEAGAEYDLDGTDIAPINTEKIREALKTVVQSLSGTLPDADQRKEIEGWATLDERGGSTLFALGLQNIANAMADFSTSAEKFENDKVSNAIDALGRLADVKSKFETTKPEDYNETIEGIAGWGDTGDFKTAITGMGTAMAAFGDSVKDIPDDSVKNATTALDTLAEIYKKLKPNGNILRYFAKIGDLTIGGVDGNTKTSEEVFTEFAAGIGKLSDGLGAFSNTLTDPNQKYDQKKVDAAVETLKNMATLEEQLKSINVAGNWWHDLLFGENGIQKLSSDMAVAGANLTTFGDNVGQFNLDINGDLWKNVSGVVSFFAGIWVDLNNMASSTTEAAGSGEIVKQFISAGHDLNDFAGAIKAMADNLVLFDQAMTAYRETTGVANSEVFGKHRLGEWDSKNLENIKGLITFMKDIAVELNGAEIKTNSNFYGLENLGFAMQSLFNSMYDSSLGDFMDKMDNFASLTDMLSKLTTAGDEASLSAQGFTLAGELIAGFSNRLIAAEAADGGKTLKGSFEELLKVIAGFDSDFKTKGDAAGKSYAHGFGVTDDFGNNPTLLDGIMNNLVTAVGNFKDNFYNKGKEAGKRYVDGFKDEQWYGPFMKDSETKKQIESAISRVIESVDDQSDGFYNKGQTAGEMYAKGFEEAFTPNLTPIVFMNDANNSARGFSSLKDILTSMNYCTSDHITDIIGKFDTLNGKFNNAINVKDDHLDTTVGTIKDKIADIYGKVETIEKKVNDLKVYIDSKELASVLVEPLNEELAKQ